jgi:ribonuclease HI
VTRYKAAQVMVNAAHPKEDIVFTGLVTVITDASLDPRSGHAGWAGRAICDGVRKTYSGSIKDSCASIHDVEIAAIANTLHSACRDGLVSEGKAILFQVDNQRTLSVVRIAMRQVSDANHVRNLTPVEQRAVDVIVDLIDRHGVGRATARHIKAHKKYHQREARHHVHEAMDRLAKQGMRQARARAQGTEA